MGGEEGNVCWSPSNLWYNMILRHSNRRWRLNRHYFPRLVDSAKVFAQLSASGNSLSPDGQNMNVALEVSLQIRPDVRPDATAGTSGARINTGKP